MQSPFKIFRKHQKVALAGLTLMAMVGFGLGDVFRQFGGGGGGKRDVKVIYETKIGDLNEDMIYRLSQERAVIQRFIMASLDRTIPELAKSPFGQRFASQIVGQYGFGRTDPDGMLDKWLGIHEAEELGIVIADSQIDDYINHFTNKRLKQKDFREILQNLHLSPKQLYDLFRVELQITAARRLVVPQNSPTPEKYWQYYQQLNTRQKVEVAAIPVDSFVGKTGEPTDAQTRELFEKHRFEFELAANGKFRPGFLQPRQVKLQYLELSYDAAKKAVEVEQPVTESQIEEYYEKNKVTDRTLQKLPVKAPSGNDPLNPDFTPDGDEKDPAAPSQEPKLEESSDGAKPEGDQPKGEKPAEEPAGDAKPEEEKKPEEQKSNEEGEKKPTAECGLPVAVDDEPASPAAEKTTEETKGDDAPQDAATPAKEETPAQPENKPAGEPAPEQPSVPAESEGDQPKPAGESQPAESEKPVVEYLPLDDVKEIIRDRMFEQRVQDYLQKTAEKARLAMSAVAEKFIESSDISLNEPSAKQAAELDRLSRTELKKIAADLGMTFNETGLVSGFKLSEIPNYGKSVDADFSTFSMRGMTTIVQQVFGNRGRLCMPFESRELGRSRYVSWVVLDVPPHIPEYTDEGIREQVAAAWKRIQAQPLAENRAEELAKTARSGDHGLQKALQDQTITGASLGTALTVTESDLFSFYQESTSPDPSGRAPQIRYGSPSGVTNPGRDFMHTVFEELGDGEVGVALNDDATIYYVVRVFDRRPADRDEFKEARLFDFSSPMNSIREIETGVVQAEYRERMRLKYAIKLKHLPNQQGRVMDFSDDE